VLDRGRPLTGDEAEQRADWIRLETIRLIAGAGLGHYSSTFSSAEVFAALYYHTLRLDPARPEWADRDRFLLGKGHAAVGLWPILADLGYFDAAWLERFGRIDAELTDHPSMRAVPGVDFSSGSLGHNLSVAAGLCLAGRLRGSDHRAFVVLGDGELHEGQVWEAAMCAAHYRLGNLVSIVDANGTCAGGPVEDVLGVEPIAGRFEAFGWNAVELDGHDGTAVLAALDDLPDPASPTPTCIVARTVKGKGVSFMEAAPRQWHLGFLGEADRAQAEREIRERIR
jgi:transketolase